MRFSWQVYWGGLPTTLAWEIPWTEESGGLQSMGLKELDMT